MKESENLFIVDLVNGVRRTILFLLGKWLIIFLAVVVAGLCGITYAWLKEPKYTAELIFSSETSGDNGLGGYASLAAQFGFDVGGIGGGAFQGDNLIELFKSRPMLEKTLLTGSSPDFSSNKLLIDVYLNNHKLNAGWQKDSKYRNIHFTSTNLTRDRTRDSILKSVCKTIKEQHLSVDKIDKKLNYVAVRMTDNDEVFAKKFVEELTNNVIKYYVDYKSKKARKNYELISRLTDSVKGLLYGNIQSYAATSDLNINPLRQTVRTGGQKIQVNAQANTALYTELLKQQGLAQVTLQKEMPLIEVIETPLLPLKKEKPGRLFTGIIFAFFGGIICCAILLVTKMLAVANNKV